MFRTVSQLLQLAADHNIENRIVSVSLGWKAPFPSQAHVCEYNPARAYHRVALFEDLHGSSSKSYIVSIHYWRSVI